jgi:hypothetical protein
MPAPLPALAWWGVKPKPGQPLRPMSLAAGAGALPPSPKSGGRYFLDNSLGVTQGLSAGFTVVLRAAQILAPARRDPTQSAGCAHLEPARGADVASTDHS